MYALSTVDRGLKPRSGQTKIWKICLLTSLNLPHFCACPKQDLFNEFRWEVIGQCIDICGIVDLHCLIFLFVNYYFVISKAYSLEIKYYNSYWLLFSVMCMFCKSSLSFCPFSFGHCVVCSSSIYGFWLPLLYLQTLLIKAYL